MGKALGRLLGSRRALRRPGQPGLGTGRGDRGWWCCLGAAQVSPLGHQQCRCPRGGTAQRLPGGSPGRTGPRSPTPPPPLPKPRFFSVPSASVAARPGGTGRRWRWPSGRGVAMPEGRARGERSGAERGELSPPRLLRLRGRAACCREGREVWLLEGLGLWAEAALREEKQGCGVWGFSTCTSPSPLLQTAL